MMRRQQQHPYLDFKSNTEKNSLLDQYLKKVKGLSLEKLALEYSRKHYCSSDALKLLYSGEDFDWLSQHYPGLFKDLKQMLINFNNKDIYSKKMHTIIKKGMVETLDFMNDRRNIDARMSWTTTYNGKEIQYILTRAKENVPDVYLLKPHSQTSYSIQPLETKYMLTVGKKPIGESEDFNYYTSYFIPKEEAIRILKLKKRQDKFKQLNNSIY